MGEGSGGGGGRVRGAAGEGGREVWMGGGEVLVAARGGGTSRKRVSASKRSEARSLPDDAKPIAYGEKV